MDIDPEDFALECIQWALYCGVPAHYMVAVAQMRGKGFNDATDGDQIGPFRLTQATWTHFEATRNLKSTLILRKSRAGDGSVLCLQS